MSKDNLPNQPRTGDKAPGFPDANTPVAATGANTGEQFVAAAAAAEDAAVIRARAIAAEAAAQAESKPDTGLKRLVEDKYITDYDGYGASRIGGRSENQDTLAFSPTPMGTLILVCDGMGGGPGGKTASSIAAAVITDYIRNLKSHKEPEVAMAEAFRLAGFAVADYAATHRQLTGMGSTVVALLINPDFAIAGHVGDSRLYQLRGTKVVYRSTDHSMVMNKVLMGQMSEEEARTSGQSNIITQALGPVPELNPEIVRLPYLKGDRFVLCSDGIWGVFPNKEMVEMLGTPSTPTGAVDATVISVDDYGRANGNQHDNLTLAIVDTNISSTLKEPMNKFAKITITALGALLAVSVICNIALGVRAGWHSDADQTRMRVAVDSAVRACQTSMNKTIDSLQQENSRLKAELPTVGQIANTVDRQKEQNVQESRQGSLEERISRLEKQVNDLKNSRNFESDLEKACAEAENLKQACANNPAAKAALTTAAKQLGETKQFKGNPGKLSRQTDAINGNLAKARRSLK